jgi:hypothetical protein
MISPFGFRSLGGDSGPVSTLAALRALAGRLVRITATQQSAGTAIDRVTSSGFSVWAVPTADRVAERLQGVIGIPAAGQFGRRDTGELGSRSLDVVRGSGLPALPWTGLALWNAGEFQGIAWTGWTGDTINHLGEIVPGARPVTTPASVFSPTTGDLVYRRIRPVVIQPDGAVVRFDEETGYQFSSAQNPTALGYASASSFSADDGVWGFWPGHSVDGDAPGPSMGTGAYGIANSDSSEPVTECWWGGSAQTAANTVAVVFSA